MAKSWYAKMERFSKCSYQYSKRIDLHCYAPGDNANLCGSFQILLQDPVQGSLQALSHRGALHLGAWVFLGTMWEPAGERGPPFGASSGPRFARPSLLPRTPHEPGNPIVNLGTKILVPGSWYQDLGTKIVVLRSWYQGSRWVPRFTMGSGKK